MTQKYETYTAVTWVAGDREVTLPAGFHQLHKLVWNDGTLPENWIIRGLKLVIDDEDGATHAGGARIYHTSEWPKLNTSVATSVCTNVQDEACLAYAMSRFFKKLSSLRAYYKRYATLVGQNAITEGDLQAEADRWYNDFLDARDDIPPRQPAPFVASSWL